MNCVPIIGGQYVHYGIKDALTDFCEQHLIETNEIELKVTSQRKNLQERKFNNILPKKPFLTLAELNTFEEKLQNSENMCAELVSYN